MYQTSPSLSHNPGSIGILLEFSVRGHERSVHRSQNSHNYSYNHDGLYIVHPSFLQEYIPRGVRGENIQNSHQYCVLYPHQKHPYFYFYPRMSSHHRPSIPPHHNSNIPPHPYPSMSPHHICLFIYCTSTTIYEPYAVPYHPQIPSLVYLYQPTPIRLP